LIKILKSKR